MPITQDDVRLYASVRMTDNEDGGGAMSPTVIVDGVKNNVFPDITDLDRLYGRCQVRKLHGSVQSADQSAYLSAHAILDDGPDDPAVSAWLMVTGGYTTERAEFMESFLAWHRTPGHRANFNSVAGNEYVQSVGDPVPQVGQAVALIKLTDFLASGALDPYLPERRTITSVTGPFNNPEGTVYQLTFDVPLERTYGAVIGPDLTFEQIAFGVSRTEVKPHAVTALAAEALQGATSLEVHTHEVRVVPYSGTGDYPTENRGIDPNPLAYSSGKVPFLRKGDAVLIHDTQGVGPTAVSNTQTVNVGRTNLARLRVLGSGGQEHARFVRGLTPPTGVGCTADLAAGTVTFTDVSGYAQPVTMEHRIEEMAMLTEVTPGASSTTLALNRALSRAYPATAKVSSIAFLGDLQARVTQGFAQTAWTGEFSDVRVGGTPTGDFDQANHPIVVTNQGAVTDRWACIFTNTNTFRLVAEGLGEIGVGNTGSDFSPINPVTGAAFMTVAAAGWSGMAAGNVYRFNTVGANTPLVIGRAVAPSEPGGADSATPELRGYINA